MNIMDALKATTFKGRTFEEMLELATEDERLEAARDLRVHAEAARSNGLWREAKLQEKLAARLSKP